MFWSPGREPGWVERSASSLPATELGASSTTATAALGTDFDWQEAEKTLPAGFIGTPADVAGLAVFFASDEARYIIGQTMVIDGDQLAVMPCLGSSLGPSQVRFGRWYVEK